MERIDIHAHYVPPRAIQELERRPGVYGTRVRRLASGECQLLFAGQPPTRPIRTALMDLEQRFRWMAEQNLARQIVASWLDIFGYTLPPAEGRRWSRLQNEALAEAQEADNRLVGLATVPLQDPTAAAEELRVAVRELGLKGVMIASHVVGMNLDWPLLDPFWRAACELNVPVIIHPTNYEGGERFKAYMAGNLLGRPLETAVAATALIFGGVLERFPSLKPVLVHGGGFLPYQVGRLDNAYGANPALTRLIPRPPSQYLRRFYFDSVIFDPQALTFLLEIVGTERVLLGSDYPFPVGDLRPGWTLERAALDAEAMEAIACGNAVRLFGLAGS